MAPDTRESNFKRIEDYIVVVSQDNSQKYELMVDLLKEQNTNWIKPSKTKVHILETSVALWELWQQLEFTLQRLFQLANSPSQGKDKQASSMEGVDPRTKFLQENGVPSYEVHKLKHIFPTFNGEDVHRWLYKCTDTAKRLMSSPKCRSVEVINNPARPGSNHREVNCINYK